MKLRAPQRDDLIYVAPILCFALAAWLAEATWVKALEWKTLDWRTQLRAERGQPPPDENLLVIGIGDRSTKNIELWPFRRVWHAQLQSLLQHEKPAVVVWDIIFGNRVDVEGMPLDGEADADFALSTRMLAEQDVQMVFAGVTFAAPTGDDPSVLGRTEPITRIVGPISQIYGDDYLEMPFPGLREHGYFGTVDAPRGAGGIVRRMPMVVRAGDVVLPSLSLQAAMRFWDISTNDIEVRLGEEIILGGNGGGRRIPIDDEGAMLINYRYEPTQSDEDLGREMPTVEYFDVLIDLHQKHVIEAEDATGPVPLSDRIILVGEFATDSGPTPRSDLSPLVFLHANALNNVLQSDYVKQVEGRDVWFAAIVLGILGAILVRHTSMWISVGYLILIVLGHTWGAQRAWEVGSWWVPVVAPVSGFILLQIVLISHRVLTEQRARAEIRGMFGSYLSPVVVEQMIDAKQTPELGGVTREITAYFSDIENFSTLSEELQAPKLVALLNEYLTACTDIIQEERGTLDKYIGDAVVAMFGAPLPQTDHAYRACASAVRVQSRLAELRRQWSKEADKWPGIVHRMRTRIGLNTGECMIGNMGSRSRFSYTMMGDDVNLAARMESGAKSWGVYTMVTQATRTASERVNERPLAFRALGRIRVKGRRSPVEIHELVGWRDELTAHEREDVAEFERGLSFYYQQQWSKAIGSFEKANRCERFQPETRRGTRTNPSLIYAKLAAELGERGVPEDWDGVYTMKSK